MMNSPRILFHNSRLKKWIGKGWTDLVQDMDK